MKYTAAFCLLGSLVMYVLGALKEGDKQYALICSLGLLLAAVAAWARRH